jgi:Mor family transcriptional regulator
MYKVITDEMKRNVLYLYKTHNVKDTALISGLSVITVKNILHDNGISTSWKDKFNAKTIRQDYLNGFTNVKFLAKKYDCSIFTVYNAINGLIENKQASIINAINDMEFTGESIAQIAKRFEVSRQYVFKLKQKMQREVKQ